MSDELPKALVDALGELSPPEEPTAAREAMLAHLHATVGVGSVPNAPGPAPGAQTASVAGVAGKVGVALKVPWWVPVVTLVGGLGGGIGLERVRQDTRRETRGVSLAEPAPPVTPTPLEPAPVAFVPSDVRDGGPVVPVRATEPARAKRPFVPPVDATPVDAGERAEAPDAGVAPPDTLRGERVLIDGARSALRRAPRDALSLLEEHRSRFPDGQLAEEREALAVQALSGLDRTAARERLERFKARFPTSPISAALEALLAPPP